jgi:4-amino-4-deoxychorismate lyase
MSVPPLALAVSGRGLVDPSEPTIRADDEGFARGRAAFETLRVYSGVPFRLEEHLARLVGSAARIGLPEPQPAELRELAGLALEAAGRPEAVLRLFWTPGAPGGEPQAIALVSEIPAWIEETRLRGQRLVALPVPGRAVPWLLPATKSTSYAVHVAAEREAKRRGADDALFVGEQGHVLEGPVTNVWWRRGATLFTPSLELGILAGETRAALLELSAAVGYETVEGAYPLERLVEAEEVFTSSSVREVMPVIAVDDIRYPRGEAALALQHALRAAAGST